MELKPCPFCGAECEVKETWGFYAVRAPHELACPFFSHNLSCFGSQEGAITAWNTRTPPALDGLDDLEDEIAEAIAESFDAEWTERDGARHVMGLLEHKGILTALSGTGRVEYIGSPELGTPDPDALPPQAKEPTDG